MDNTPVPDPGTTIVESHSLTTEPSAQPWLSRHLTFFLIATLTAAVVYLAVVVRDERAIIALLGTYGTIIGVVFGGRLALKIPGKDS